MIVTALQLRWRRAQSIPDADVQPTTRADEWLVHSQAPGWHERGGYLTTAVVRDGVFVSGSCSCADCQKMTALLDEVRKHDEIPHPGIPVIYGEKPCVMCKHLGKVLLIQGIEPDCDGKSCGVCPSYSNCDGQGHV